MYSYTRKEKEGGENFTVRSFIVCTHQLIWLGQLIQGGQIGRADSLHGKMTNAYTLVSCVKGGYIIQGVITSIWTLTLRLLMSYICGAPILDVSRSHTTTQHSR